MHNESKSTTAPGSSPVRRRLVIAGTSSGAGKTTITLGLMKAFAEKGLKVQGFKCGPDYIDPTYHTAVTGIASRNLDSWMTSGDYVLDLFKQASADADISIIEGVMGLYDGKDPRSNTGSTAEIAMITGSPVVLVVDVRSMARSAAAIVLGYQRLEPKLHMIGVIVNRCGSRGHYEIAKAAIEQECGIPVLGWLPRDEELDIPERHLGLVPAIERGELEPLFRRAAERIREGTDLDRLWELAGSIALPDSVSAEHLASPFATTLTSAMKPSAVTVRDKPVIAVARDVAFNFYYEDNMELLRRAGADLVFFSPLAGEGIPAGASGLYLGGGFPEEYAAAIAANQAFLNGIRQAAASDMPMFAECGGYMVLARTLTDRAGEVHTMAGIIPAHVRMQEKRAALGYREARAIRDCLLLEQGEAIRGHEFHYSVISFDEEMPVPHAYESKGMRGITAEGYARGHVLAGYTHVHLASQPKAAERWVRACALYGTAQM
ncbi:cobyrinate a,c-diamide synthase [Paenibacillus jiagnxiensis]|uniref:cobyrinate a,c-diamide synthase n=1 Tax=Paenibacillus jiagnxiensis TaxID=3228926 RepID=UPI0033A88899